MKRDQIIKQIAKLESKLDFCKSMKQGERLMDKICFLQMELRNL